MISAEHTLLTPSRLSSDSRFFIHGVRLASRRRGPECSVAKTLLAGEDCVDMIDRNRVRYRATLSGGNTTVHAGGSPECLIASLSHNAASSITVTAQVESHPPHGRIASGSDAWAQ